AFEARRRAAFDAERAEWERRGEFKREEALAEAEEETAGPIVAPDGCDLIEAPLGGRVWKMLAAEGAQVAAGEVVAIIEAMKTECEVISPAAGVVRALYVQEKQAVAPGAAMLALAPA
ncbi:MAG: acetyl-CoA carboxylase biotin carboxyl carrier protein subunit, partial [Hyphomonadaceae bacterium]